MKVVLDTSIYSRFARQDAFWILENVFGNKIIITYLVKQQIIEGISKYPKLNIILDKEREGVIKVISEVSEEFYTLMSKLPRSIGDADNSCIALASIKNLKLATEDFHMREVARKYGVKVIGTKEILKHAIRKGYLNPEKLNEAKLNSIINFLDISLIKKSITDTDYTKVYKAMGYGL